MNTYEQIKMARQAVDAVIAEIAESQGFPEPGWQAGPVEAARLRAAADLIELRSRDPEDFGAWFQVLDRHRLLGPGPQIRAHYILHALAEGRPDEAAKYGKRLKTSGKES